jgi:hypothetical protein
MGVWPECGTSAKLRAAQKPVPAVADERSPHYLSVYSKLVTNSVGGKEEIKDLGIIALQYNTVRMFCATRRK